VTFPELYTADHTPLIGRDPGTGAFLALGFSGKGLKMSAGLGELITRELLEPGGALLTFASPERFLAPAASVDVGRGSQLAPATSWPSGA
jgi:sarcosine oxidase